MTRCIKQQHMPNEERATKCINTNVALCPFGYAALDCVATNVSLRMHQMRLRVVSDCRRYLPSRVREKRSILACVPSQESGGRNNVAFVRQRNGEARLKRKAKSDWNTLVCPPFFLRFIPTSFGSYYHARHRCFRTFYILYYNKRNIYVRLCKWIHILYRNKNTPFEVFLFP